MTTEASQLLYLAGLFDGEGSFNIQVKIKEHRGVERVAFTPRLTMSLHYGHAPLYLLQEFFGGSVYKYADGSQRWNTSRRRNVIYAAEALQPHLIIKRQVCKRYLDALSMFPPITRCWQGRRLWTNEKVLKVAEIALTLNPLCPSKREHNLAFLERIRALCNGGPLDGGASALPVPAPPSPPALPTNDP
jgi:LAGLIDADG endonuclease